MGQAYREVARATGGKGGDLCEAPSRVLRDLIAWVSPGPAGSLVLPRTPVSSSLRVWLAGDEAPRSREEGFEYFAENNGFAFFGMYRDRWERSATPPFAVARYRTFGRK